MKLISGLLKRTIRREGRIGRVWLQIGPWDRSLAELKGAPTHLARPRQIGGRIEARRMAQAMTGLKRTNRKRGGS